VNSGKEAWTIRCPDLSFLEKDTKPAADSRHVAVGILLMTTSKDVQCSSLCSLFATSSPWHKGSLAFATPSRPEQRLLSRKPPESLQGCPSQVLNIGLAIRQSCSSPSPGACSAKPIGLTGLSSWRIIESAARAAVSQDCRALPPGEYWLARSLVRTPLSATEVSKLSSQCSDSSDQRTQAHCSRAGTGLLRGSIALRDQLILS
jgi:hypothetical protein